MTQQAASKENSSVWAGILENIPTDGAAITVYVMIAIFVYVLWRNASWD